ncbi:MAG: ACT domain-containing protein [Phycisphaerae bacterium]|nr:ACT domain-containing protein [Phycisphaerae bacterium]
MMKTETQFSVFLVNKPGVLAQVTDALAEAKVNIVALTMMDSSEHGVLRLVASDAGKARDVLKRLNVPMTEAEVLLVELPNKPGSLADVCGRLASAHVNISYAYVTTGAPGGRACSVLKVADTKKAVATLNDRKPRRKVSRVRVRRPPASRR